MTASPELLYHTTLAVIDYHNDPSGAKRSIYILATHATVEAAKAFTSKALNELGYDPDDFQEYAVRSRSEEWKHGDGILVYAKADAGQVFLVGIDTTPNNESLSANADGSVILPTGAEFLHYVVQTTIDYNKDRTGSIQETEIEGSYIRRADAFAAAQTCLDPSNFAEYDRREDMSGEWPFGEDVIVHAVAETGQNTTLRVTTVAGAHKKHSKQN